MKYLINFTNRASAPHQHKNYEIVVYLRGSGYFCTLEQEYPVSSGTIIVIPPNTQHFSKSSEKVERIYINGEFNQIFNLSAPTVIFDNTDKEGALLAKMIYNNRFSKPDYISALCNTFAHFIMQRLNMDDKVSVAVKDIANEITSNFYDTDIDLAHILRKSGYAEDYIRSQFKKSTGFTPNEFLTKIRIDHACYMIDIYKDTLSLAEISEKCGYTDYVYFSRRFKQLTGMSPRKYIGTFVI